jgi:hypothetical protein
VSRADLAKLWPLPPDEVDSLVNKEEATLGLREGLERAGEWHDRPMPDRAELRRLLEMLEKLRSTAEREIEARDADRLSSDLLQQKLRQAGDDIHAETIARFGRVELVAFLETSQGLERLPYGLYWRDAGGRESERARRALAEGAAPSNRHPGLSGAIMVHAGEFQAFADEYLKEHRSIEESPPSGRFNHPVWDLRDVIGWVLDRDPAQFGRIHSSEDARSAVRIVVFYKRWPRKARDPNPLMTILHALQRGELVAHQAKSALPREHWGEMTGRGLCAAIRDGLWFWRDDVLALWPDLRVQVSRCPPPIKPLSGIQAAAILNKPAEHDRLPNWTVWKHIPNVKSYEAVALSLNIDPNKIRHSPSSWMADKRLFDESDEFKDRLFVVERNIEILGVVNSENVQSSAEDPEIPLSRFAAWAASIGWEVPNELSEFVAVESQSAIPQPKKGDRRKITKAKSATRHIAVQTKCDAVASFLAERYHGIPPGMTKKEIAHQFELAKKVRVDPRTVRRALGGS